MHPTFPTVLPPPPPRTLYIVCGLHRIAYPFASTAQAPRQRSAFNQALAFDTSGVISMRHMFWVRSPALCALHTVPHTRPAAPPSHSSHSVPTQSPQPHSPHFSHAPACPPSGRARRLSTSRSASTPPRSLIWPTCSTFVPPVTSNTPRPVPPLPHTRFAASRPRPRLAHRTACHPIDSAGREGIRPADQL